MESVKQSSIGSDLELRILITGANSGLGFAICTRLIDEFLETPASRLRGHSRLNLILTTRSPAKADDATRRLKRHITKLQRSHPQHDPLNRIHLQAEQLDLTSILSIRKLCSKLLQEGKKIDTVICNAGIGGWTGLNWPLAIWTVMTDLMHGVTYPVYKISGLGWQTKPQFKPREVQSEQTESVGEPEAVKPALEQEDVLGEVFMANVFGHYMLAHWLMPLLRLSTHGSRVVWLSSLEAYAKTLSMADFQGLKSASVYEQTKRVTDVLVLSSELPSTKSLVRDYFSTSVASSPTSSRSSYDDVDQSLLDSQLGVDSSRRTRFYLSHPGVCATSIIALPLILEYMMVAMFYFTRILGSPWHTCSAYKGACAPVWLALSPSDDLDHLERSEAIGQRETKGASEQWTSRKSKWGSAVSRTGEERVARTETEGWGWAGQLDEGAEWRSGSKIGSTKGRWRHASHLDREGRESFEVAGREVWAEMERLRKYWEERLMAFESRSGKPTGTGGG